MMLELLQLGIAPWDDGALIFFDLFCCFLVDLVLPSLQCCSSLSTRRP